MPETPTHRGYLDAVSAHTVTGWAMSLDHANPVEVTLWADGQRVGSGPANRFRIGVHNKGLHPSGYCGFQIHLQEQGLEHAKEIRATVGEPPWDLEHSPWDQELKADQPLPILPVTRKVFFMHIAKTAGSSANAYLGSHFAPERVWTHLEGNPNWQPEVLVRDFDFLSGHLRLLRVENILDLSSFFKITLLRDPVRHLASHLAWVRHVGSDGNTRFFKQHTAEVQALARELQDVNFADPNALARFFDSLQGEALNLFENGQTRYFLPDAVPRRLGRADLLQALETFDRFDLVGTVERYAEFQRKLTQHLCWPEPEPTERLNQQPNRFGLDLANPDTWRVLAEHTAFDRVLYQEATAAMGTENQPNP